MPVRKPWTKFGVAAVYLSLGVSLVAGGIWAFVVGGFVLGVALTLTGLYWTAKAVLVEFDDEVPNDGDYWSQRLEIDRQSSE